LVGRRAETGAAEYNISCLTSSNPKIKGLEGQRKRAGVKWKILDLREELP
jgi:hypothetical protein